MCDSSVDHDWFWFLSTEARLQNHMVLTRRPANTWTLMGGRRALQAADHTLLLSVFYPLFSI